MKANVNAASLKNYKLAEDSIQKAVPKMSLYNYSSSAHVCIFQNNPLYYPLFPEIGKERWQQASENTNKMVSF